MPSPGQDWIEWHAAYNDPDSSVSRRLVIVRRCIGEALDEFSPGPVRILSLCAGDGRDLLPELRTRPPLQASTVLVELDSRLAEDARSAAFGLDDVEVRQGDAGRAGTFGDVVPVDLLLLCGIFGNITADDIRSTVASIPSMLAPGGVVIWTRGSDGDVDIRPEVRRWFVEAGLEEVAFYGDPETYGVGVARAGAAASPRPLPDHLFTFVH